MPAFYFDILKYMELYTAEGWINAGSIISEGLAFNFLTGGRGIGKTYGFLDWFLRNRIPFIFMRRTQVEADLQGDPATSSLTANLTALDMEVKYQKLVKGKLIQVTDAADGREICICCALSTFHSVRGIDLSRYRFLVYDEFITEPHVKTMRAEGLALFNVYESVNRNRELAGQDPLILIGLSNSLNIANDIFIQFDLVTAAEQMINNGNEVYRSGKIQLIIFQHSPISERKADTALYQTASEEYARMALKNEFILNDFSYVKKRSLKEYTAVWSVGDLYIYRHKHRDEFYCCFSRAKLPKNQQYGSNYLDLERMKKEKIRYWFRYIEGLISFESYKAAALFEKYYK